MDCLICLNFTWQWVIDLCSKKMNWINNSSKSNLAVCKLKQLFKNANGWFDFLNFMSCWVMLKENGLNQLSSKSNLAVCKWIVWVLKFHMTMSFAQRLCTKFLFSLQGCHAMTNKRILCYRWKISREIIKKGSWLTPSALTFSLQHHFLDVFLFFQLVSMVFEAKEEKSCCWTVRSFF